VPSFCNLVSEFNGLVSKRVGRKTGPFLLSGRPIQDPSGVPFFDHPDTITSYMSKVKTAYFCQNCGYESTKWLGKCPSCQQWNTFVEELIQKDSKKAGGNDWQAYHEAPTSSRKVQALHSVQTQTTERVRTIDEELNRVLGGGIVPGSIVLVAGEPGIGKSTLFLQMGLQLQGITVLYISGEESEQQVKMRADRLGMNNEHFYLLTETSTQNIFNEIKKLKPELIIVDSIQTLESPSLNHHPARCRRYASALPSSSSLQKKQIRLFSLSAISPRKDRSRDPRYSSIW
jgi:predicted ATP-dependent serine protease